MLSRCVATTQLGLSYVLLHQSLHRIPVLISFDIDAEWRAADCCRRRLRRRRRRRRRFCCCCYCHQQVVDVPSNRLFQMNSLFDHASSSSNTDCNVQRRRIRLPFQGKLASLASEFLDGQLSKKKVLRFLFILFHAPCRQVVLTGDSGVGKSNLLSRFTRNE